MKKSGKAGHLATVAWLNGVQAVGKMLELKAGEGAHLMYDIFVIR